MSESNINVKILTYYGIKEMGFIPFNDNPLNEKIYNNTSIEISKEKSFDGEWEFDRICIGEENPIDCALLDQTFIDDMLVLKICQDWG